ncbi:MAG: nucleotidyltransferase [Spirochaetia bacterium]
MNILIPMAGEGNRFKDAGYTLSKPEIPTYSPQLKKNVPMVVAATLTIPGSLNPNNRLIYIDRDCHQKAGLQELIKQYLPHAQFITINYLTQGQAQTCLLGQHLLNLEDSLFIGCCDNGILLNEESWRLCTQECDGILISHTNDANIEQNPYAHSWAVLQDKGPKIKEISVKQPISDNPLEDHATTGMFWFKKTKDFIHVAQEMIAQEDKVAQEYYVDKVIDYLIKMGQHIDIFDVDYLCWGTPYDYENYMKTIKYWKEFLVNEGIIL